MARVGVWKTVYYMSIAVGNLAKQGVKLSATTELAQFQSVSSLRVNLRSKPS